MIVPVEFYEELRTKINVSDIVRQKVSLTRKGTEYLGLCPFHNEKTPSFTVNDNKRFYYCFGCSEYGDVIKFIASTQGMQYKDAAIKLAELHGIELPKMDSGQELIYDQSRKILSVLAIAKEFFQSLLSAKTQDYLSKRRVSDDAINTFGIGFASGNGSLLKHFATLSIDQSLLEQAGLIAKKNGKIYEVFSNRLIFPIYNIYDKVIGFGGRVLSNDLPKYLNSPETIVFKKSEVLYGENKAASAIFKKNYAILVEGYFDVIALHSNGFTEAVASLGTAVNAAHIQRLWKICDEVIICLDSDIAGIKAKQRLIEFALPLVSSSKSISFIELPANTDPDTLIIDKGKRIFQELVNNRYSLSQMLWLMEFKNGDFSTPESRAVLEATLNGYCKQITDTTLNKNYHRFFKEQIWENVVRNKKSIPNFSRETPKVNAKALQYSEMDMIEHAICSVVIQYAEISSNVAICEIFASMKFFNLELAKFRNWLSDLLISGSNMDELQIASKSSGFYTLFLLLSDPNNEFVSSVLNKKSTNPSLFWEFLCKKHYLVSLKQEYSFILTCNTEQSYAKAASYKKEILKTSKEIQDIVQLFQ